MKIVHEHGFTRDELAMYIPIVHRNAFDSAYQVVAYMKKVGLECVEEENRVCSGFLTLFLLLRVGGSADALNQ